MVYIKMYEVYNGILYKNGKPGLALGVSYYPSYHHQKVPVPENGDRVGEMWKDFQLMKDAGFNMVRMAALGTVERNGPEVGTDFPFIDAMLDRAEEIGLACMVRLQGYSMNLSGYKDALMLDEKGIEMPYYWGWFVRNCLNHPGILKDNEDGTMESARHFSKYPAAACFQIYNEPMYPDKGFYDYNPYSIKNYRDWLVENGYKSSAEASVTDPPRKRPERGENTQEWILWRQFGMERLNWFLYHIGNKAKEAAPNTPVLTCHITAPMLPGNATAGIDYYKTAEQMDILGITNYLPSNGPKYFLCSMVLDGAESAAATFGKHYWIIEYNGHTTIPAAEWERETYNAIGGAAKGILYYQWRADYPYEDGPEPEGFGLVFNDGRKTQKYDGAIRMNAMVNQYSRYFASSEKVRSGVAILFSNHGTMYFDAIDNGGPEDFEKNHERYPLHMRQIYTDFRKSGIAIDFTRACDLDKNPLSVKLLLLPSVEGLDKDELAAVDRFSSGGGAVLEYEPYSRGFNPYKAEDYYITNYLMPDANAVVDKYELRRNIEVLGDASYLDAKLLKGCIGDQVYHIVALVNYDPLERIIKSGSVKLTVSLEDIPDGTGALFVTPENRSNLEMNKSGYRLVVSLPEITTGGFIFIGAGF